MPGPIPYVTFPGNAREALEFYASVFGGTVHLNTFDTFARTDGPPDAIAHGVLDGGPVSMFGSDAAVGEASLRLEGVMLALLGTADPSVLHRWFDQLATDGTVIDPLAPKPWGAADGQVIDRFGMRWLIGYEPSPYRTARWSGGVALPIDTVSWCRAPKARWSTATTLARCMNFDRRTSSRSPVRSSEPLST